MIHKINYYFFIIASGTYTILCLKINSIEKGNKLLFEPNVPSDIVSPFVVHIKIL